VTRKKWPTAFPLLYDLADDDAYTRGLETHLMGYSEYLAALIYDRDGRIPRELELVPVKLVEDLKIRIDQTLVECVTRIRAQNAQIQSDIKRLTVSFPRLPLEEIIDGYFDDDKAEYEAAAEDTIRKCPRAAPPRPSPRTESGE